MRRAETTVDAIAVSKSSGRVARVALAPTDQHRDDGAWIIAENAPTVVGELVGLRDRFGARVNRGQRLPRRVSRYVSGLR